MAQNGRNMIAEAIRRRREIEEQEQAQQLGEQNHHEGSPPPAGSLFGDPTNNTGEGEGNGEGKSTQRSETSLRRRRSPSMDANNPEEWLRKYGCFAESECNRFSLRGSRRNLVIGFAKADLHEKLVTLMAFLQRHETDQANSEVQAYLTSGAFKDHAVLLFHAAVVAPHNKSYVTGLGTFLEDDMVRNHALYKIDKLIIEDEESRGILNSSMRIKLTALRNTLKDKLETAVVNNHCMNQVVLDIMPKQIEVTIEHRQRWAWILAQYREYRENYNDTTKFWRDLDKFMASTELELAEQVSNKRARDETRAQIYASALEEHEQLYPNQVPAREPVDTPSWQVMLERSLAKYHSF